MKHTKGTWTVVEGKITGIIDVMALKRNDEIFPVICRFDNPIKFHLPSDQVLPNAHLIAAAPDLLAACKKAMFYLHEFKDCKMIEKAIAKAEGKQ